MPDDALQPRSLAYRNDYDDIWNGEVPNKYRRLLPFIEGRHILEIGAAEGVLSLCLAREEQAETVTGLELREYRHQEGLRLQARWRALGFPVDRCTLVCGDIREHPALFDGMDTLVAIRTIYYLRDDAQGVLRRAAQQGVARVVLGGNAGRQRQYRHAPKTELGQFNRLASVEGMRALLEGAGYEVVHAVDQGDPIVVGHHPDRT